MAKLQSGTRVYGALVIDTSSTVGNATNYTTANVTGIYPVSNTLSNALGSATNRWALNATTGAFAGAVSGITTLAAGNTTITGFANVTSTIQGGSSLTIAGALSGVTTAAMGNTTITGFANVSTSVNSALLSVGTSFIANTTGAYHTGTVNAVSFTTTNFRANTTGAYPASNTAGNALGNTIARWALSATTGDFAGAVSGITTLGAGNTTITGDLSVTGNTTLGNAATDGITINANTITIAANASIDAGTLYIDSLNNRVGINTTAPILGSRLHVASNANTIDSYVYLENTNTGTGAAAGLQITTGSGGTAQTMIFQVNSTAALISGPSAGPLVIDDTLYLVANGNVGIGNTSPAHKLSVNGPTYLQGITTTAANVAMANNHLDSPTMKAYKEFVNTASISTNTTLDFATTNIYNLTLGGNLTFTFSNPPASGTLYSVMMILKQDATGSRTITWPASVKWPNASAPTLSTGANAVDVLNFFTVDGGTTYYGALSLANLS